MKKIKSLDNVPAIATYLRRVGAEPRSLRTAVVREIMGRYWRDLAVITFDHATGEVRVTDDRYAPNETELSRIAEEMKEFSWPTLKLLKRLSKLPPDLAKSKDSDVFEFRNLDGDIVMLQQRVNIKGEKKYIPWTFWDDDEWRRMEPEGKLPLWGLEQLADATTVFIHEGAKAAKAVRMMVEAKTADQKEKFKSHPWSEELSGAAHIGWIGGALSPERTDWSALAKAGVKRAYIVSDNDAPGVAAVPKIAYQLRFPTFHIQFTQEWPASFDLADDFPDRMFRKLDGKRYYTGPSFRSCLHPATWATDQIPQPKGKGRPITVLREHFKDMWAYVEEVDIFVCVEMPEIVRQDKIVNNMLASFSHVNNTTALMVRAYRGRSPKLCYRPDIEGRVVTDKTTSAINLHTPTHIKPVSGVVKPFMDFISYLIPNEAEQKEVLRWAATIIARPDIRLGYAMLMVSEKQGMGKTLLAEKILAPLVGDPNASFPSEQTIVESDFNGWIANKRLIVVGEIYSGHSWKAYNKLKSLITDVKIDVNEKYMRPHQIDNWGQFYVCSNSRRALKMEDDDRRWYYPVITEVPWPREKFAGFINWLQSGGLNIIRHWAMNYGDYVLPGTRAPMTHLKKELIEASRSEAQREVADLAEAMTNSDKGLGVAMKEIEGWVRAQVTSRVFDSDLELRKVMVEVGCVVVPKRLKIGGRLQYVIINSKLYEDTRSLDEKEFLDAVRKAIVPPNNVLAEGM